ncbi:hypothetical protein RAH41_14195 [Gottfriedia acidiceleris]|uniref:hypothetical protein n=1 Tax=Gottfriedia acidiceleris TaxID=371036 RepID=UPI002F2657AE
MQSGNIDNFKHLSQFNNIKDFNNNIEQWMVDLKIKFTKSELVALKRLIRFSAKVAGVCNAKIGTVVSATHDKDGFGISRSTFKRMISKAKEFGLIFVYDTVRKNGSKSNNVYVFNRFCVQTEPSENEKLNQPQTHSPLKTNNQNIDIRNKEVNHVQENGFLDASFVSEKVPTEFTNLVKCYFDNAKKIEEYWKLVSISANNNKVDENILETAINAFRILVRKIKLSNVTNTYGFYFGILNRKFKALYWRLISKNWWELNEHQTDK